MLVTKHDLARLLAPTQKIVEKRNTIPILSTVRLIATGGKLTATMTDLDMSIEASVPAEGDLKVCVDANLLAAIVSKAAGDEIEITPQDNAIVVKSGRNRSTLHTLPVDDFPTLDAGKFTTEFETDLSELLAPCQFAMSSEETRYYLNGIYLHAVEDGDYYLRAVATDGHRLSRNSVLLPDGVDTAEIFTGIIVPRKTVGMIPKGVVRVRLSSTKIQFETADADGNATVLTSKLIDGTFPDYQRVIPSGNDKIVTFDVPAMKQAAERVSVVSSERGRAIKLSFADNQAVLAVSNPDAGSATEEIAVAYEGEPIEIGFNAAYLGEVVSVFPAGDVRMALADSGSPTVFTSEAAEGLLCVLMPMRV